MLKQSAGMPEFTRTDDRALYPLTFQQERIFYLNEISPQPSLWTRAACRRLSGPLDPDVMGAAVTALVERHAVLRTRVGLVIGTLAQSRHDTVADAFEVIDLSDQPTGPAATGHDTAQAVLNRQYEQPFALNGSALFKVVLVKWSETDWQLILKIHHILSDATTLRILWSDLKRLYNSLHAGTAPDLPPLERDYLDYAAWLREHLTDDTLRDHEAYWLGRFAPRPPDLDLPSDFPGSPSLSFAGAMERLPLPAPVLKSLHGFSLAHRVIPFSTLLTAYALLLHAYCRQTDLVIGTVFSGRHQSPKLKTLAGFFTNTVALRARLDPNQTVADITRALHQDVETAWAHQDYPFERLVDRLDLDRDHRRNPLFRAMFNMVSGYEEREGFVGITRETSLEPNINATQVDLFLDIHMTPEGADLRIEYNTDLFAPTTIQRMARHYVTLLDAMMTDPTARAVNVRMLTPEDERQVLAWGGGANVSPAPFTQGIVERLQARAAETPDHVGLIATGLTLTCRQINRAANRIAARLIAAGVAEGDRVAVMLHRSPAMVLAILGILKAGAAYVPIDPAFPHRRMDYILRNSGVSCLLVGGDGPDSNGPDGNGPDGAGLSGRSRLPPDITTEGLTVLIVDNDDIPCPSRNDDDEATDPRRPTDPDRAAYVLYTSGSTGMPKGVVVQHGALMNTLDALEVRYAHPGKTILLKTNVTFDVSATELFGWLYGDGRVAVLDPGAEADRRALFEAIETHDVTHINFVPSVLDALLTSTQSREVVALRRLHVIMVAGEALPPTLVNRVHEMVPGVRLENLYGPTEAAIYATWHALPRGVAVERVPIGAPLPNTRAYVLDGASRLLPVGVAGELCLAGAGLAAGYLDQPDLTSEAFRADPFRPGERLYRTGDLAKWGDDGLLYYLGRTDGQVKVRGFRVETGEVERRVLACRGVANAVVSVHTDRLGQKRLVAHVVAHAGQRVKADAIRAEVAAWLPSYMVPDAVVLLDRLPRLPSGKIDRRALPDPEEIAAPEAPPTIAASALERTLIGIAERLLDTSGLTPESNFFRLGGNSLLTLRFIVAIDEALGTRLSAVDFLRMPTIGEIARMIEPTLDAEADPGRDQAPRPGSGTGGTRAAGAPAFVQSPPSSPPST